MKFLVVGDTHYVKTNAYETSAMEAEVDRLIVKHNPDIVVFLGDTLDRHSNINMYAQQRAQDYIIKLATTKQVVVLIGNHDRNNRDEFLTDDHPFSGLVGRTNILIANKAVFKDYDGVRVCYVPFVADGRFMEAVKTVVDDVYDVDLFFAHQDFKRVSGRGDEWPLNYPTVISGHNHTRYQKEGDNLIYPGAPLTHKFGDDETRYALVFTMTVKVADDGVEELSTNRMFEKLDVPVRYSRNVVLPLTDKADIDVYLAGKRRDFVRLKVSGTPELIDDFKRKYATKAIIVPDYQLIHIEGQEDEGETIDFTSYTFKELLQAEIDNYDVPDENLKAALARVMKAVEA